MELVVADEQAKQLLVRMRKRVVDDRLVAAVRHV
jgi:hypothetical protein